VLGIDGWMVCTYTSGLSLEGLCVGVKGFGRGFLVLLLVRVAGGETDFSTKTFLTWTWPSGFKIALRLGARLRTKVDVVEKEMIGSDSAR